MRIQYHTLPSAVAARPVIRAAPLHQTAPFSLEDSVPDIHYHRARGDPSPQPTSHDTAVTNHVWVSEIGKYFLIIGIVLFVIAVSLGICLGIRAAVKAPKKKNSKSQETKSKASEWAHWRGTDFPYILRTGSEESSGVRSPAYGGCELDERPDGAVGKRVRVSEDDSVFQRIGGEEGSGMERRYRRKESNESGKRWVERALADEYRASEALRGEGMDEIY